MYTFSCCVFLSLEFHFLPLLWKAVPYPSRLCSIATRSLKRFLLSFPSAINDPIFSAPQHFTPILLHHRHCLPVQFGCLSDFSTQPGPPWAGGLYLTHFRSSYQMLQVLQVTPRIRLKGWLPSFFVSICTLSRTCLCCYHKRAVRNHWSLVLPCAPCCCYGMLGCDH